MIENKNNELKLPEGWISVKLEDLTLEPKNNIVDGPFGSNLKASEYLDDGIPIIRLQNIDRNFFIETNLRFITPQKADSLKRHSFSKGDIVITKLGEPLGKACLVPDNFEKGIIVADIVRVRTEEQYVSKRYLVYLINSSIVINQLQSQTKGTTRPRVNLDHIRKLQIPISPLNEQRRIVAKIETLKARSQRVKEELEAIPVLLDQFRQSVLAAAFRGDLTADWREENPDVEPASELWEQIKQQISTLDKFNTEFDLDLDEYHLPNLPDSWIWLNVTSLSTVKGGKRLPKGESLVDEDTGYPYIKAGNLKNGTVILDELQYIPAHIHPSIKNYIVSAGDVYITIVGACIGDAGIIPDELDGANLTENAAKLCDIRGCKNQYLALWLRSPSCQEIIRTKILSAAQGKLALSRIKTLPVPLSHEKEQLEIIKKIELMFNNADRIEQQYKKIKAYLDQLDRSILAKAFRGELVPQDPNDEPASVLLERIRAEREKLDTKKKAKGNTEKKSRKAKPEAAEPEQLSLPGLE